MSGDIGTTVYIVRSRDSIVGQGIDAWSLSSGNCMPTAPLVPHTLSRWQPALHHRMKACGSPGRTRGAAAESGRDMILVREGRPYRTGGDRRLCHLTLLLLYHHSPFAASTGAAADLVSMSLGAELSASQGCRPLTTLRAADAADAAAAAVL
jgi:hypothetical protein